MNATLFNGANGILTHQVGLDVTSNNISNVNTVGYRGNTAEFKSFLSNAQYTLDANSPINNGYNWGTAVAGTPTDMKSGSYKSSNGEFHVAYSGKGWFTVGTNKNGSFDVLNPPMTANQSTYFTRNGQFMQDADGYLVNTDGYYLYGVNLGKIGTDGVFQSSQNLEADLQALSSSELKPMQIPKDVYYRPNVTTEMNLAFNLNRTEASAPLKKAFSNIDGSVDFDGIFAQNMNAFMNKEGKPIDVRAQKDFTVTKTETITEQVPNPNFNPDAPVDPETNPETIEQTVQRKRDIHFVYGQSVTDDTGAVTKQGFTTLGELRDLLAAEGLVLDVQRSSDGNDLEGSGLVISAQATNPGAQTPVSIKGSLAEVLGLKAENVTLNDAEGKPTQQILGSAIGVPTYGYSNSIYDDQGNIYSIRNQFYLKQAGGVDTDEVWTVKTSITNASGDVFYSDNYTQSELTFRDGKAVAPTTPVNVPFLGGSIALNLTGTDEKVSTSFSGTGSTFSDEKQNGVQAGRLKDVTITEEGFINLNFTNGRQEPMGRVGITAFVNDQGLKKIGGNLFAMDIRKAGGQLGAVSGPPLLAWDDKTAGLKYGSVLHKKIELGNVDVASALTELIVYQRGYSFNAKAFTTGDELIKEVIGLKR